MDAFSILNYGKKKQEPSKYGGFNRRMLAATIDSVLLLAALPVINRLAPLNTDSVNNYAVDPEDPAAGSHLLLHILNDQAFMQSWVANFSLQMLAWCIFSAFFLHFYSATPGKMLLRMKVVDAKTEGPINDLQVFLRSFGYLVSTVPFGLGFFWIGFTRRKRGWHDYLADTVVINLPMPWKKAAPAPKEPAGEPTQQKTDTP